MSRCLDPQTPPEKAFRGSKYLLTRYLEDFGSLEYMYPDEILVELQKGSKAGVIRLASGSSLLAMGR